MFGSKGGMASPLLLTVLAALALFASCSAGPLPLPNVTSATFGLKRGSCAVGDLVYLPGEPVPGASACERCACAGGAVSCVRTRCEPRPGCKALHRPDHCCPTYQCECEQEGRVYGNGEKLVDPADPCRVCYCQGGEVVCRRIACFVRDDCSPRLVPGRCCPEYDNCPLRGVTTVPGITPSVSTAEETSSSPAPSPPRENIKQEITIKEITPVSEIPVIPEVKLKEVLPTPGIEVPDYPSSKSPLIVREAITEGFVTAADSVTKQPIATDTQPSPTSALPAGPSVSPSSSNEVSKDNDSLPSKISLSNQDSINNEMYPAIMTSAATMGSPSVILESSSATATTKASVLEEEDPSLFDHNPAFPPLPDDLSVLSNHEDELLPDPADSEHMLIHEATSVPTEPPTDPSTTTPASYTASSSTSRDTITINSKALPENTIVTTTSSTHLNTENDFTATKSTSMASISSTTNTFSTAKIETTPGIETMKVKDSPMLNLRTAIPTEILDIPSSVPEEINGALDDITDTSAAASETVTTVTFIPTNKDLEQSTETPKPVFSEDKTTLSSEPTTEVETTRISHTTVAYSSSTPLILHTASPETKSNTATEITAQTEFSSIPIETSDQKPKENSDYIEKELSLASTVNPSSPDITTTRVPIPTESEVITVSRSAPSSSIDPQSGENIETTEFIITAFGSSESATDAVELIKISAEPEKKAAIIEPDEKKKNNVLTDLINLVGDVAAIGDHTDTPESPRPAPPTAPAYFGTTGISDSEELIPVNAGYKSKNSNWNLNSITELPIKSKSPPAGSSQKVVEIEDEEAESITDSLPPNDKVEPTTRRPLIDHVSDDGRPANNTGKRDIEIITKSYVPTINRRPTKVVMKKIEQPVTEESSAVTDRSSPAEPPAAGEGTTPGAVLAVSEVSTAPPPPAWSDVATSTLAAAARPDTSSHPATNATSPAH